MNNRQTGGIPTKVRMPPVFEIKKSLPDRRQQGEEIQYIEAPHSRGYTLPRSTYNVGTTVLNG